MSQPHSDAPRQPAPHAAAEADPRDPSRAANQAREEPVLTTPAHDRTPSAATGQPDTAADGEIIDSTSGEDEQAGVAERAVTDVAAAPGTSEGMRPVEGVHTPDAGPGGAPLDTDEPGLPGRTTGSR